MGLGERLNGIQEVSGSILFGSGVINPKVSGVHDQIQPEKKKPVPLLSANLYTGKCQ